ncbi:MAG: UvrD-helicase domain-containing protein [Thermodesulfobacteriota bacterium]|nr:UvrD-helicase domain-containing protein [Thermodesulfobacteriota bacterium]
MKFIADLHIHSHFSRATSKTLDPEHLSLWAQKKGINVIGTGDFTHPGWVSELQDKLVEAEDGLYRLKSDLQEAVDSTVPSSCLNPTRFLLSGEISCIYKKNGKTRKVHHLILMPDMESVIKLNGQLDRIGNISSDGRPILGLDSRNLLELTLAVSDRAFFIPAHIWTPWFSVFGSKSGFDSLEECFEDLTGHIHALETGLSSDPPMNRRLSALDRCLLVSNSDAHSPGKLGREANVFDTVLDYGHMIKAMTEGKGFIGTVEFYPEEGKYHFDGHRKCRLMLRPDQTKEYQGVCPQCGRPLTVGVLHRVFDLSDRDKPMLSKDFFSLIPLQEILSELLNCGASTKKTTSVYEDLLLALGPELQILLDVPLKDIEDAGGPLVAKAVDRMRRNQVIREGGYDGEYGNIRLFHESERPAVVGQMNLFGKPGKKPSNASNHISLQWKAPKKGPPPTDQKAVSPADPILDPLNLEQKEAVSYQGGNLLIVAGPGTGKTMTVAHRIAYLIRSGLASQDQVIVLTFTRKAAREMEQRISGLMDASVSFGVSVATFHGFCLDLLRSEGEKTGLPPDFILCSELDGENLARKALSEAGVPKRSIRKFLKGFYDIKKASVLGTGQNPPDQELFFMLEKYRHWLRALGMADLDDLEVEALRLLRDHHEVCRAYAEEFPWIFVDEYQDTNPVQVELLKTLIREGPGVICAIGDPDQAIYGFRGADVKNFHSFVRDFPGARKIELNKNYRSAKSILECSAALMGRPAPLQCVSPVRGVICLAPCSTESEEAEMVVEQIERLMGGTSYYSLDSGRVASYEGETSLGMDDICVLFRLNAQGDALEKALNRAGIPFVRSGEAPLISRYPANILWRFFQCLRYPDNTFYSEVYDALLGDYKTRRREEMATFKADGPLLDLIDEAVTFHELDTSFEDSSEVLRHLRRLAAGFEGNIKSFLDILSLERGIDHGALAGDRVALMSLHAAKGLEWDVVFVIGCEDRLMPYSLFGPRDEEEERRLLYVGMTRARSRLILSHASRRVIKGRTLNMKQSPFIDDIPKDLCGPIERRGWKPQKRPYKQLEMF